MKKNKLQKGFGVFEIVIGSAIISVFLFAILGVTDNFITFSRETQRSVKATFLLEEAAEALRYMRDNGWQTQIVPLTNDDTYYLEFDGVDWEATTTNTLIDGLFNRIFILREIRRDADDDINDIGTIDPNTRQFDISVFWQRASGVTTTHEASFLLTNFFDE